MSISGDNAAQAGRIARRNLRAADASDFGFEANAGTYELYRNGKVSFRHHYNPKTDSFRWVVSFGCHHVSFKKFHDALNRAALVVALGN